VPQISLRNKANAKSAIWQFPSSSWNKIGQPRTCPAAPCPVGKASANRPGQLIEAGVDSPSDARVPVPSIARQVWGVFAIASIQP
jgi:hypothetical protein